MKILTEVNEGDAWKEVEPTEDFLKINNKAKELVEILREQYPSGCELTLTTFDMSDDSAPYWLVKVNPTK